MPQLNLMNKVDAGSGCGENHAIAIDIPKTHHTWRNGDDHLETDKNVFLPENEKNSFVEYCNYFERTQVNLQWRDITLETKEGHIILSGLSGSACSGELTAVMGPSGSGKTSLVNVLSGFIQQGVTGQILLNGVPRDMTTFPKITCYILQDDHVLPRFTVRELVTIASRLKMPPTVSEKERQKTIDDCIYSLGLVGQQNQTASTISSGQRKRLCIAQEIVSNPPLIFLDEPTSGLDSSSCLQFMQLLKSLAEEGKNVICTIHQPSSRIYDIFDNLYMISEGQCIYRGSTKNLLPFLADQGLKCPKYYNPTDYITDIAIGLYGDWNWKLRNVIDSTEEIKNSWYQTGNVNISENGGPNSGTKMLSFCQFKLKFPTKVNWFYDSNNCYATSFWNQFRVLLKRSYLTVIREPMNLRLKLIGSTLFGLVLGLLYYDTGNDGSLMLNTAGLLFMLLVLLIILAQTPTVLTFPLQRIIFEREYLNSWYSIKSYYWARTTAELPFQILFPSITCSLVYWLTGQPAEMDRFFLFVLSSVMVYLIAESIGLMIGAVSTVQNGIYTCCIASCSTLLFSGFLLPMRKTSVYFRWLYYISYSKYGFQSYLLDIYKDRKPFVCQNICTLESTKFLEILDMNGDLYTDYWAMLIILIFCRIASYLSLLLISSRVR